MIYLFDTNVISEAMKAEPDTSVSMWLKTCPAEIMATTAITRSEILYGIRRLPEGRRRAELERAAHSMFAEAFAGRVMAFDTDSALTTADIRVSCAAAGTPVSTIEDVMIAGIARQHGATVITRDRNFAVYGVPTIDPWTDG